MKILTVSLILIFCLVHALHAQQASKISFSQGKPANEDKLKYIINYTLEAPYSNIPCQVQVKYTTGDKAKTSFYLKQVTGDVGNLVYPGPKKQIVWDYVEELVHFSGQVSIEIEVVPSVQVTDNIKKGKQMKVTLAPIYTPNKNYAVKLFLEGAEVQRLSDVLLIDKSFEVTIPKKGKVKRNYQIAITDGESTFYSNTFKIKPKISYAWGLVPVLAIPAYLYINQYIKENEPLPGPPSVSGD